MFNYVEEQLAKDKKKRIIEFGSGCGHLAIMLQYAGYDVTATDTVDDFLTEQKRIGINQVKKYNFLLDDYNNIFDFKDDLIVSWRNPHLDMDDMQRLFDVAYNALTDNGLLIINFQNADVHPNANLLPNGTKYDYKILEDKKTIGGDETVRYRMLVNKIDTPEVEHEGEKLLSLVRTLKH